MRVATASLVAALTLPMAGCKGADDATLIGAARETCVRLAKAHFQRLFDRSDIELHAVPNVESDPTTNAFEFVWLDTDITGKLAAEKKSVRCSGNAEAKTITQLSVGDEFSIATPQTY